jgi:hypothetical protein
MCWSRHEWHKEMARREELRKESDQEADRRGQPVFLADEDVEPDREPEVVLEREPVGAER